MQFTAIHDIKEEGYNNWQKIALKLQQEFDVVYWLGQNIKN